MEAMAGVSYRCLDTIGLLISLEIPVAQEDIAKRLQNNAKH
jgi:hypothetical protein